MDALLWYFFVGNYCYLELLIIILNWTFLSAVMNVNRQRYFSEGDLEGIFESGKGKYWYSLKH